MKLSQFKFKLTDEQIAKYPAKNRDESRLMVVNRKNGSIEHCVFKDIINFFDEHDLFVFNDTRVFPALLYGNKEKTGAKIEVFLLRELNEEHRLWDVLVDPARKIRIGNKLYFGEDDSMVAEVIDNTTSDARCDSSSTVRTKSLRTPFISSGNRRFPGISTAPPSRKISSVTRLSLPVMKALSWLLPQDSISVGN